MNAILTQHLTKAYRKMPGVHAKPALDHLTLAVEEGEVFGFLGQNGAGKTTTIKILASLLRPSEGSACILGEDVRSRAARRLIGYLPENPYFYEYLTPRETIDFYGKLQGLNSFGRRSEWKKLSVLLNLESIADQRVRTFSKGMRQRLAFAVALVGNPPVLVLDEPMSGLDPLGRRAFRELILQLHNERKTLFFSSHVLSDVEQICNRVGILVEGRLATHGRLDELLAQRISQVEVIAEGLDDDIVTVLAGGAARVRRSEAGHHFYFCDHDHANRVVELIAQNGGRLIEYNPIKQSLESYFMQHQGEGPSCAFSR